MIGRILRTARQFLLVLCCVAGAVNAGSDAEQPEETSVTGAGIDTDEIERVLALSDDVDFGEYLAGECASCHLGTAVEGSNVPVIHGAEPAHLVRAMLEFRAGIRSNTTMGSVANGLDDEEISAIVHYLALSTP